MGEPIKYYLKSNLSKYTDLPDLLMDRDDYLRLLMEKDELVKALKRIVNEGIDTSTDNGMNYVRELIQKVKI